MNNPEVTYIDANKIISASLSGDWDIIIVDKTSNIHKIQGVAR